MNVTRTVISCSASLLIALGVGYPAASARAAAPWNGIASACAKSGAKPCGPASVPFCETADVPAGEQANTATGAAIGGAESSAAQSKTSGAAQSSATQPKTTGAAQSSSSQSRTAGAAQSSDTQPKTTGAAQSSASQSKPTGAAQPSIRKPKAADAAAKQFEGIIRSRNRSVDYDGATQEYEMTIWVKKDQIKVTVPRVGSMPGSTVIYRTDSRVSWILDDQDRTYFEVALAPDQEVQGRIMSDPASAEKPVITRTNRTRKLLGYLCEQVTISKGETETEIWGTKELGDLSRMLNQSLHAEGTGNGEVDLIAKMGLYPLQSTTRFEGRMLESQEVTTIERTALSDDLFRIPAGYKRQKALDVE